MLAQLRESKELVQAVSDYKTRMCEGKLAATVEDMSYLHSAMDSADMGDLHNLHEIRDSVKELEALLASEVNVAAIKRAIDPDWSAPKKDTVRFVRPNRAELRKLHEAGADLAGVGEVKALAASRPGKWRTQPIVDSGLHTLIVATLRDIANNTVNADAMVRKWQDCLMLFRISRDDQIEGRESVVKAVAVGVDTAAAETTIPRKVGKRGYVITSLPLLFTVNRSLKLVLHKFPRSYEAIAYAGGYLFQNQLVVGIETEGKTPKQIAAMIDAIVGAYRAEGKPMVNVLSAGRKYPYFLHRGNPLAFVWLMPENIYKEASFSVDDVQFNPKLKEEADEDAAPKVNLAEQKAAFEASLAEDELYTQYLNRAKSERLVGNNIASMQYKQKAEKRREDLRQQWIADMDGGGKGGVKTPARLAKVYKPSDKRKITPAGKLHDADAKFAKILADDPAYVKLQLKVKTAQDALDAARASVNNNPLVKQAYSQVAETDHEATKDLRAEARAEWQRLKDAGASAKKIQEAWDKLTAAKQDAKDAQKQKEAVSKGVVVSEIPPLVRKALAKLDPFRAKLEQAKAAAQERYDELWEDWEGKPKQRRDRALLVPVKPKPAIKTPHTNPLAQLAASRRRR